MSAMVEMSRAMRHVIEDHSHGTLETIPDDELRQFVTIVSALAADLRDELMRRSGETPQP